jgi:co-chaperonin GroES (HSP10)
MFPIGDFVFVRMDKAPEQSVGGILLPQDSTEAPRFGLVVKVGPGKLNPENGQVLPMFVVEGDRVLVRNFGGQTVTFEDEELLVCEMKDIMASDRAGFQRLVEQQEAFKKEAGKNIQWTGKPLPANVLTAGSMRGGK